MLQMLCVAKSNLFRDPVWSTVLVLFFLCVLIPPGIFPEFNDVLGDWIQSVEIIQHDQGCSKRYGAAAWFR